MRTTWSTLPLALAVIYSGMHAGVAGAATPATGSVTDRTTSASYTAGPFLVPNTSGLAGDVMCNAVLPCDDFTLKVEVPAAYAADHNLTVRVQWANATADFDLYVLDEGGNVVGSA